MHGTEAGPREGYVESAYIASKTTYAPSRVPDGWEVVKHEGALAVDLKTADAMHLRSPKGQEFVAFRGTAETKDWKDNLGQPLYAGSEKYDAAARIGTAFKDDLHVTFTGHSLGGGLAKMAAETASLGAETPAKTSVTFNAAWVAGDTYAKNGCDPHHQKQTSVQVENQKDILTYLHESIPVNISGIAKGAPAALKTAAYGTLGFAWGTAMAVGAAMTGDYKATTEMMGHASQSLIDMGKAAYAGYQAYQSGRTEILQARGASDTYTIKVAGGGDLAYSTPDGSWLAKPSAIDGVSGHKLGTAFDPHGTKEMSVEIASESHASGRPIETGKSFEAYDQLAPAKRPAAVETLSKSGTENHAVDLSRSGR